MIPSSQHHGDPCVGGRGIPSRPVVCRLSAEEVEYAVVAWCNRIDARSFRHAKRYRFGRGRNGGTPCRAAGASRRPRRCFDLAVDGGILLWGRCGYDGGADRRSRSEPSTLGPDTGAVTAAGDRLRRFPSDVLFQWRAAAGRRRMVGRTRGFGSGRGDPRPPRLRAAGAAGVLRTLALQSALRNPSADTGVDPAAVAVPDAAAGSDRRTSGNTGPLLGSAAFVAA